MKGFTRRLINLCVASIAVGIGLLISGFILGGKEGLSIDIKNRKVITPTNEYEESEMGLGGFDEIDVYIPYSSLEIIEGDSFKLEYSVNDKNGLKVEVNDRKLKLEYKKTSSLNILTFNNDSSEGEYFKLYVPEGTSLEKADIDIESGSFKLAGIDIEELKLENESGSIKISDMKAKKSDIKAESGSVKIENADITKLELKNEYGSVTMDNVVTVEAKVKLESGSLKMDGFDTSKAEIESEYGSAKIILKGSEADYSFELENEYGSLKLGDKSVDGNGDEKEYESGSGSKKIKVKGESGSINIDFEK